MTTEMQTLERAALFIAEALSPLVPTLGADDPTGEPIRQLVRQLGWELSGPVPPSLKALRPTVTTLGESSLSLAALMERERSGEEPSAQEKGVVLSALLVSLGKLINDLSKLQGRLAAELPAPFVNATKIDQDFVTRLLDSLFIRTMEEQLPAEARAFRLLGIFEIADREADPALSQTAFTFRRIHWERIPKLFQNPAAVFKDAYGWGTTNLELAPLLDALQAFSLALDVRGIYDYPSEGLLKAVAPGLTPAPADIERAFEMSLIDTGVLKLIVGVTAIPKAAPGEAQGIAVALVLSGGETKLEIPLTATVSLIIEGSLKGSTGIALALRPGKSLSAISDFDGARSPVTGARLSSSIAYKAEDEEKAVRLLSFPGGSGLELHAGSARSGFEVAGGAEPDLFFEVGIDDGRFVLGGGQGDGFINKILPADGFKSNFQLTIGFSYAHGIYFKGGASLEIQLPVHVSIGPIEIQALYLVAGIKDGKVPLEISSTIAAHLGPLQAVVERLGVTLDVEFPGKGGNLGPVNMALGFKPPNGVGLSLDTGVVKGGGYLFFDFEKEEYAGALELVFSGFISLKAIGLITTRMPDGSKGFSLLIIITAEFGTGIQLGFGFTLLGVGGLIGLNRTMRLQPLMEGVRTGAINSIMFPQDVIANAPRIISDLRTIFPPEEGKFLIGPMAKLGWGTPTLISLSLGIIIEIPGNIAIVGVLRLVLPDADAAILILQVNFAGAIEFDKKRFFFFAALFDSRILFMTIEGEMGVLAAFGDDANFVVSVGGFHPRFNPPPLPFPSPKRISVNIANSPVYRIRVEGYFAVTTNTAQFGARAELVYGTDDFGLQGHLAFDALFQFSPFYFIIEISASASLKVFGIGMFSLRLRLSLEGPTPWRARGEGSISLLFFEISADFDITWGEARNTTLRPIKVMPVLKAELEKANNWKALPPVSSNLLVSLRKVDNDPDNLVLHPVGALRLSQKAVPLDLGIDKVGNQKPEDARRFTLKVTGSGLSRTKDTLESFAPAQFQNMDDAAKLSRPAYELMHGGIELSVQGQDMASGKAVKRAVRYEEVIIDNNFKRFVRRFRIFFASLFTHFLAGSAVTESQLSKHYKQQLQPYDEKVKVNPDGYTVAFNSNNQAFSSKASFTSAAMAQDFMRQQVALDPGLGDSLHVIPQHEVHKAA